MKKASAAALATLLFASPCFAQQSDGDLAEQAQNTATNLMSPPAQNTSTPSQGTVTEFTVAPYLLLPTVGGNMTIDGRSLEVDLGPGEIFGNLQFGMMGYFEARRDKWGFAFDALYANLEKEASVETPLGPGAANLGMQQGIYELSGIYGAADWADIVFGIRINNVSGDFETLLFQIKGEDSKTWADPFVGVKLIVPDIGNWRVFARIDFGGFGVGSNYAFQIYPTVGYDFAPWFTLAGGFRLLKMKYETGEGSDLFVYDMSIYGPFVGFVFRF